MWNLVWLFLFFGCTAEISVADSDVLDDTAPDHSCGPNGDGAACKDLDDCSHGFCGSDGLCHHQPNPTCAGHCTMVNNQDVSSLASGWLSAVYGKVGPQTPCPTGCDCTSDLAVFSKTVAGASVALGPWGGESWSCEVNGCSENSNTECDALIAGREYLLWGHLASGRQDTGLPTLLSVDGFCMAPTAEGLEGQYSGTLSHDGVESAFEANIVSGQLLVTASADYLGQMSAVEFDDVSAHVVLRDGSVMRELRLFPGRDSLHTEASSSFALHLTRSSN